MTDTTEKDVNHSEETIVDVGPEGDERPSASNADEENEFTAGRTVEEDPVTQARLEAARLKDMW
ncbi:MAG TPA: hypothetical protein VNO21_28060, partial [Polyangiaceae bacterium]|nr:hypothetical protein [Polyangiaceae bacterium]